MTLQTGFHPEALEELTAAAARFEAYRSGLGDEFVDAVAATVRRAAVHSSRFMLVHMTPRGVEVRRARLAPYRFRYVVVFAVLPLEISVIAVPHTSQRPGYWMARLTQGR
jgi:hypothetical protein